MPKFAETMSEEQRRAVVEEALALGNAREAWRRAKAGTLRGHSGPVPISYTYLCELVQEEKQRRDPEGEAARGKSGAELADDIIRRELRRLDTASRGNRLNAQRAREMARAMAELERLTKRGPERKGEGDGNGDQGDSEEKPKGVLERLAAELEDIDPSEAEQDDAQRDGEGHEETSSEQTGSAATSTSSTADETANAVGARAQNLSRAAAGV